MSLIDWSEWIRNNVCNIYITTRHFNGDDLPVLAVDDALLTADMVDCDAALVVNGTVVVVVVVVLVVLVVAAGYNSNI